MRDQNLQNLAEMNEILAKRGRCEEMHTQLKEAFNFNLKGCRKNHRALYLKLDFIAAQFMLIAYICKTIHQIKHWQDICNPYLNRKLKIKALMSTYFSPLF